MARVTSWLIIILLIPSALLLSSTGCSKSRPVYKDSSKPIEIEVEQEFDIELKSNATTGYRWQLARPLERGIVKLVKSEYKAPENPALGEGGEEVWTFQGIGRGRTLISLKYVRFWEKSKPPVKNERFQVLVR